MNCGQTLPSIEVMPWWGRSDVDYNLAVNNLILYLVIGTALAFDFTNGFHDTANAMATSIATGAFKPRTAVSVAAVLNLVGAFLSLSVAATIASGIAIALGTFIGGWRIIRTLGKGITDLESPQGFAAETSSATTILTSSYLGFPLSTTQVCTSSVVGSGLGAGVAVRWPVFGRMIVAWILTFPAALGVGALTFAIQDAIGGNAGVAVTAGLLAAVCLIVFLLSRKAPVTPANVNDAWDPTEELPTAQSTASN